MSTLAATNLKHASSASNNIVLDSSGNATFAGTPVPASSFLRNRFINGGMVVDQRNAGASRSCSATVITYVLDRWFLYPSGATLTAQQVTGTNVNSPFAFRITGAAGSTACNFEQRIENLNTNDLASQVVTVSFRVWCSGAISNASVYALSPTVVNNYASTTASFTTAITLNSGLNTIRVTGTLNSTANLGQAVGIAFNSGIGSGVTVDISEAQLEVGSAATPFERRQYGQELALCQRYYEIFGYTMKAGANYYIPYSYKATKRTSPTLALVAGTLSSGTIAGTAYNPEQAMRQVNASTVDADAQISASAEL